MTESTRIDIKVKFLDSLLLEYYKKYFQDDNIKLLRNVYSDTYHGDNVTTIITRKVKIGNYEGEKKYILSYDEIKNIINKDLEQYGYWVDCFKYEVLNDKLVNIEADLKEKQKVKQKTL